MKKRVLSKKNMVLVQSPALAEVGAVLDLPTADMLKRTVVGLIEEANIMGENSFIIELSPGAYALESFMVEFYSMPISNTWSMALLPLGGKAGKWFSLTHEGKMPRNMIEKRVLTFFRNDTK